MSGHVERVAQPSGGTQERSKGYRPGCKVSAAPSPVRSIQPEFTFAAVELPDDEWGSAEDGGEKLDYQSIVVQPTTATIPTYSILKRQHHPSDGAMHPPVSRIQNPSERTETPTATGPTEQPSNTYREGCKVSAAPPIRSIKFQLSVAALEFFPTGGLIIFLPILNSESHHYERFCLSKIMKSAECETSQKKNLKNWQKDTASLASTDSFASTTLSYSRHSVASSSSGKTLTQSIATQTDQYFICANCANTKNAVARKTDLYVAHISVDLSEEEWGLEKGQYEHEDIASMDTQRDDCALLENITFPAEAETLTLYDIIINENDMPAENEPEFRNEVEDSDDEQKDWTPRLFSQRKPANQSASTALKPWLIDPESEDEAKTLEDIQVDIKSNAQARRQETRKKKLMQTQRSPPGARLEPQLFQFDEKSAYRYTPDDEKDVQPCFTVPSVKLPCDEWNEQESQSFDYEQSTYPYAQADSEQGFNFKNTSNNKKSNSGKRGKLQGRGKRGAKTGVISFEELSARALELSRLAYERNSEKIVQLPWKAVLQRVPGVWLVAVFVLGLLGPAHAPLLFSVYFVLVHLLSLMASLRVAYGAYHAKRMAAKCSYTDWATEWEQHMERSSGGLTVSSRIEMGALESGCGGVGMERVDREGLSFNLINHVIIIPNYKENMDTLCETLDVLASHSRAISQYKGETAGKHSNVSWAARQMTKKSKNMKLDVFTVMDADTAFAEDYFNAVTYHYTTAPSETRMFNIYAPSTVFDRNAKDVPVFVRLSDMLWSAGVMGNYVPFSPITIPCSAYSLPMELIKAVDFWDVGSEGLGEDMHMFLKCFFATEGRIEVTPIFSPASCCNIEGPEGSGAIGFMRARYGQAKRHLWGCLDFGYTIHMALLGIIAPGYVTPVIGRKTTQKKSDGKNKNVMDEDLHFHVGKLLVLIHRLSEAHIVGGHMFMLIAIVGLLVPLSPTPSNLSIQYWQFITAEAVHPMVMLAAEICGYIRFISIFSIIACAYNYEQYQQWVGVTRWQLSQAGDAQPLTNENTQYVNGVAVGIGKRVQHLGRRAELQSFRTSWNYLDWFAIPVTDFVSDVSSAPTSFPTSPRMNFIQPPPPYVQSVQTQSSPPASVNPVERSFSQSTIFDSHPNDEYTSWEEHDEIVASH
ncbi:hypothetical protein CcCBS67573_g05400 [Chytriomyces confervae]|uniref:Glycosyltransferase 2-like domain-containing protein n=1 Tax=Chytriomyces confervae TaxID=246404 RepID=A0A507FCM4_9FUNG|nr:hypothetical protein CcCBS67573_g05400 [Chytriomyces confervae]